MAISASRLFSVAPMMDCTDRHCRYFMRSISRNVWLYSEMVVTGAVLHGDTARLLAFDHEESPVALQLGGNDPAALARSARIGGEFGYSEINLNVGCPSNRVESGQFGASLMRTPQRVAECVTAMQAAVSVPVTVKSRIGVDRRDSFDALCDFLETVSAAGCEVFILHARKAVLGGLTPKQNRDIPPLRYDRVYKVKEHFPGLEIIINGGIRDLPSARRHLAKVDGVMLGREAYRNPYILAAVDNEFFGDDSPPPTRKEVLERMLPYVESRLSEGVPLAQVGRHLFGLFQGQAGARRWRRHLGEQMRRPGAGVGVLMEAAAEAAGYGG